MNEETKQPVKSKRKLLIASLAAVLFLCVCVVLAGLGYGAFQLINNSGFSSGIALANATPDPGCSGYECLQVCMSHLPDILGPISPGTPDPTEAFDLAHSFNTEGEYDLATYKIKGDALTLTFAPGVPERLKKYQQDTALHHKIWDFVMAVIPASVRDVLTTFTLKTSGSGGGMAASTNYFPPAYYLEVDIFEWGQPAAVVDKLVFETGRLLTINNKQVQFADVPSANNTADLESYQLAQKKCDGLYFDLWCALPNAYVRSFYERFWKDRHDHELYQFYHAFYHQGEDFIAIGRQLYKDHPDEFLNGLAAAGLSEDIAVSFKYFILGPKPQGKTIAEQKILFFYEFPELVKIREQIIQGICGYAASH